MKNKILTIFAVLFLIGSIIFVNWKSFHHEARVDVSTVKSINIVSGYFLGFGEKPDIIPDDQRPVTIAVGEFKKINKDKVKFVKRKLGYVTLAQRQINILFIIDILPDNFIPIIDQIKESLKMWQLQGNEISAVFLDYRPKKPEFKKYLEFTRAFRKHIPNIHILPVLSLSWLNNKKYSDYLLLKDKASFFLVAMDKEENTTENIKKLDTVGYGYRLRLPKGYLSSDVDAKTIVNSKGFGGAMANIDSKRIIKEKKIIIGIMPKFLLKKD